jgi:hypothetical protein
MNFNLIGGLYVDVPGQLSMNKFYFVDNKNHLLFLKQRYTQEVIILNLK